MNENKEIVAYLDYIHNCLMDIRDRLDNMELIKDELHNTVFQLVMVGKDIADGFEKLTKCISNNEPNV